MYLLVKPLARWRLLLAKFCVAVASTVFVVVPALLIPWLVLGVGTVSASVPMGFAVAIGGGAVLYCALFVATLGLVSKRALVLGLCGIHRAAGVRAFLRRWREPKSFSIREFVITVAGKFTSSAPGVWRAPCPSQTVWTMGTIILAEFTGAWNL